MEYLLRGKRVAALVANGFEQSELFEPKRALEEAGATVDVISPDAGTVRGWKDKAWGDDQRVDHTFDEANADDYDAVLLPGGVMNPDALRMNDKAVRFVRDAFKDGKPIAAICHGPWTLIDAGVARSLHLTSWPSLKSDLRNAGAEWEDAEVVVDRGVVTSRKPADIPAFNRKMIEEFAEGRHSDETGRRKAHTGSRARPRACERSESRGTLEAVMAKYGRAASSKVERAMRERKRGTLKSGRSGKTVKSRKQAIAIGLSEARREGAKVPRKKTTTRRQRKTR